MEGPREQMFRRREATSLKILTLEDKAVCFSGVGLGWGSGDLSFRPTPHLLLYIGKPRFLNDSVKS